MHLKTYTFAVACLAALLFSGCPPEDDNPSSSGCTGKTILPDLTLELSLLSDPIAGEEAPVRIQVNVPEPPSLECANDNVLPVLNATYTGLEMEYSVNSTEWDVVVFETVSGEQELLRLATPAPLDCLEPVDTASVTFYLPFDEPGFYRINATADLENDVPEREEGNNQAVVTVEVE
ncbi:MAG: hypothetical protein KDD10_11350 [Phaeodactylibacter sp.]|nr:hypothetical protein [Phaeodactylibacter sp.]MCB9295009.1 hypothetical protein [Lewinellaceae bacterium]